MTVKTIKLRRKGVCLEASVATRFGWAAALAGAGWFCWEHREFAFLVWETPLLLLLLYGTVLRFGYTAADDDGIEDRRTGRTRVIRWDEVAAVEQVGGRYRVRLAGERSRPPFLPPFAAVRRVTLTMPRGLGAPARLDRLLATAPAKVPVRRLLSRPSAAVVGLVLLLGWTAAWERPWLDPWWPGQALVTGALPDPCAVLAESGFPNTYLARPGREECGVEAKDAEAFLTIWRFGRDAARSPSGRAADFLRRRHGTVQREPGLGDERVLERRPDGASTYLYVRKADVVIVVALYPRRDSGTPLTRADLESRLKDVARAVLTRL
ncbi:PH domain-containing protein [Actinocorallia longicatena]|uniref:Low molecular weight protein antigen 6 PH domain-containing protein n=1 Tax=Actinocorallia longicatena TaxID=111803 RepID=A0ABP6PX14_9ACTN